MSTKKDRAKEVAEAIAFIQDSNLHDIADKQEMSDLIEAYFVSPAIDSEEGSSDEEEGDFDEPREPAAAAAAADSQHDDLSLDPPSEDEEVTITSPVTVQAVLPDGTGDLDDQQREIGDLGHQAASVDVAMAQVARFSCKCKYFNDGPCYMRYTTEEIMLSRDNMAEMPKCE